jgi:prepilin-type N-terminal cleavage/methylation domain-containing protein/prepilin-type processing-associated H-X9-DG protein
MRNYFNSRGFTLIELLVVIAIIAVLAAILFPVFARAREKARQSTCMSNQRQIAAAVQMYAQDHEECMPDFSTVWQDIKVDNNILQCPTAGKGITNAYTYNAAKCSNVALGEIPDSSTTWLTADGDSNGIAYRHTNKTIASYVDGHVTVVAAVASGQFSITVVSPSTGWTDDISIDPGSHILKLTTGGTYNLSVTGSGTVDYLVIGGGGGGGGGGSAIDRAGGGGGAGQVLKATTTLSAGTFTVTVGGGGAGINAGIDAAGNNGSSSSFTVGGTPITAAGGGGGMTYALAPSSLTGIGSSGGVYSLSGATNPATLGAGCFIGGTGGNTIRAGGGGGGSTGPGNSPANSTTGSGGGAGYSPSGWSNDPNYFAAGGGGGRQNGSSGLKGGGSTVGSGGGGGNGGYTTNAEAGKTYGSGGGGAASGYNSGAGQVGVVMFKYQP